MWELLLLLLELLWLALTIGRVKTTGKITMIDRREELGPSCVGFARGRFTRAALVLKEATLDDLMLVPTPIREPIPGIIIIGIKLPWGRIELIHRHPKVITFFCQVFAQVGVHGDV